MSSNTPLQTRSLTKEFGGLTAVDDVTTSFSKERITAIIGANGAGKTTFVSLITGRLKPTAGSIIYQEDDITEMSQDQRAKIGISQSFQHPQLYPNLTVRENVRVNVIIRDNLYRGRGLLGSKSHVEDEVREVLETFKFEQNGDLLAKNLPHGDRKILDVILVMTMEPGFVFLDEPTSGVGAAEKDHMMEKIIVATNLLNCGLILIEHDLELVRNYSDEVKILNDGRIVKEGTTDKVFDGDVSFQSWGI